MERQKVVSREYKVMLRSPLFTGAEESLLADAHSLWQDVVDKIGEIAIGVAGDLSRIKTRRVISFLDTRNHRLGDSHYIFRERRAAEDSEREVTLKFRHPDRFLAQARDMKANATGQVKTKFEEDIKVPFVSLHSFSTTAAVTDTTKFARLGDVIELFPGLAEAIEDANKEEPLLVVKKRRMREVVLEGAHAQMGKTPKVDSEWALIVWYDQRENDDKPITVELSYRYGDKNEEYGAGVTRRASEIFEVIQTQLKKWVDPKPRTKTAVAFQ
jgi:hypothetical protein